MEEQVEHETIKMEEKSKQLSRLGAVLTVGVFLDLEPL